MIGVIAKAASLAKFKWFERQIHLRTRLEHDAILAWAEKEWRRREGESRGDEVESLLASFRGRYAANHRGLRVLIHVPPFVQSPGGHSLFRNLAASLDYIGVPTRCLTWDDDLSAVLREFTPTVLLTSDSPNYLRRIDWSTLRDHRRRRSLALGLTASIPEYGSTPVPGRLSWAKQHGVDFYYSFRAEEYLRSRASYRPFFDAGYRILTVEFGANPLIYYPVPDIGRDLDFVFLASSNRDKRPRYYSHLSGILRRHGGFINGPGWRHSRKLAGAELHRYLYARAKVGLNLHISDSIDWPSELNERTYILAACGVPQLVDEAQLLPKRYSRDAFFIAATPADYDACFEEMLANSSEARRRAEIARRETLARHTTFHRAEGLARQLWYLPGST